MAEYNLAIITSAIEDTLAAAAGINRSQDASKDDAEGISDNIPEMDMPLLQVVPLSWGDSPFTQTHVGSFAGHGTPSVTFKPKEWVFEVFVYVSTLSKIRVGLARLIPLASALEDILDEQEKGALFGHEAIHSFTRQSERTNVEYSSGVYLSIHITLTLSIW